MFFIQQANDHDCGFTALKILLANIHHDSNYLFMPSFSNDTSFLDLMKEAEKYQTELTAQKATNKEEIRSYREVPFIARLGICDVFHAVYVYKINKKYIYYFDPARGKKKIFIDEFISLWTGEMLVVKNFTKYTCPFIKPKFMKNSEIITSLVISLISAISSVLAIYFVNKESVIYLPIIFFTVMLISEIILKKYSLIVMKHIDNRVEELVGEVKNKDYMGFYDNYEAYKKYLLVNNLTTFSSFYIFILISIVFVINDKMNFIFIIVNLLIAAAFSFIVKPLLNEDESFVKENEEKIKRCNDKVEAFSYMNMARDRSFRYVDKLYSYQYVVIAIEVILTFIMMMYNQLVSVTYLLCYSFLQIYLYKNIVTLLTSSEDFYHQDCLLNKIVNIIENK